jgi:hypothetical protein
MTESRKAPSVRTPWHLWVIGVTAFLWNCIGAFDYVMTETRNPTYMSAFTPEQLAYFYSFPAWAIATWATAVWGGVLGSVLLLMRRRLAVWIFLISLVAMVLTTLYNYVLSSGLDVFPDAGSKVLTAVIFLVALGLFLYARAMSRRGLLA